MKRNKIILLMMFFLLSVSQCRANTIDVGSFYSLMNTALQDGDVFNITDDLDSDESIGQHFYNYDINFDGNYYSIDGNMTYGGFILSKNNDFSEITIRNCQGQAYQGSNFAGAIFNSGGQTEIYSSNFYGNFVDSGTINFGVAGAVYNLFGGLIAIENSSFENNYTSGAGAYGGSVANGYNDNGTAEMTVNNTQFKNNHAQADVFARGGAMYNNGIISVNSASFEQNYVQANGGDRNQPFIYGGAVDNDGEMKIENGNFAGNYALGTQTSAAFGGAVYNNKNLTIVNSVFDGNYIDSEGFGYGGAIYNNSGANLTLENSILENNSLSSSLIDGDGGAVYNSGVLNLNNTTFQNNHGKNAENNDIFNAPTGIVNFLGGGTNNIRSGIKGTGTINKNDGGELNLGGNNAEFSGNFNFSQGTLNLLAQSSYFSASNTSLGNGVNFNMVNSEINNINFGALDANGTANIFADMDFNTNTMDRINANSFSGGGNLLVSGLNFIGAPSAPEISIPFADDVLKNHVSYNGSVLGTPIYDYSVSYDASDGNFELSRLGFNSAILSSEVAAQLAGYLTQIDTYRNIFENLDMVMLTPPENRAGFGNLNKIAASNGNFTFSPFAMPEQNNGIWFKPYSTFESVGLKNGPRVSNVSYGSLVGAESGLKRLKRGWYGLYGVYAAYNGSHQAFQGNSIYNNGGLGGVYGAFYRGNFFTVWTANAGASSSEANTGFGRDNFAMFNTGIAQMSGYNWQTLKRKLIIQPRIIASYSFINTFSYTTASNVNINTRPLNALQIEPGIKLIGNFKDFFQPYLAVSVVWNIIDSAKFKANDVYLPDLSVKPFVQYGAGVQKRWNDRFTCFFETMLRNGGRNGVALLLGMRITI